MRYYTINISDGVDCHWHIFRCIIYSCNYNSWIYDCGDDIKYAIVEIDEKAFITITQINEVRGRGFSMDRVA